MLLRPRKTIFKSFQKKRSHKTVNTFLHHQDILNIKSIKLVYGQFGIKNKNPHLFIFNKTLFKVKLFLKKAVRRSNITNRYLWVKIFPHIPITRKVIGSRMGKGKGKSGDWAAKIPSNSIFIELKNVRPGRANYFLSQIKYKLPGNYKIITRYSLFPKNSTIAFKKKKICYDYFF